MKATKEILAEYGIGEDGIFEVRYNSSTTKWKATELRKPKAGESYKSIRHLPFVATRDLDCVVLICVPHIPATVFTLNDVPIGAIAVMQDGYHIQVTGKNVKKYLTLVDSWISSSTPIDSWYWIPSKN